VKTCSYCGRENNDDATLCSECGTDEFVTPVAPLTEPPIEHGGVDEPEETSPEDSIPDPSPFGETVVCTTCQTFNGLDVTFCRRCGAPIGFISTIGPLESVYAEGFAYRQAVQGRPKLIVVFGIWLIFFPCLLVSLGLILTILNEGIRGIVGLLFFWLFVGFGVICAVMLYRVTRNFLTKPKPAEPRSLK
jgi:ribosomal protein L40E